MRICDLSDNELDYWVAKAEGYEAEIHEFRGMLATKSNGCEFNFYPSCNWEQAGPIVEREMIAVIPHGPWSASKKFTVNVTGADFANVHVGKTATEAAMRCYVASKYGETVPDMTQ